MKATFLLVMSFLLGGSAMVRLAGPETLSVCRVLADLKKYRDKDVQIRGEWIQTDHGMFMRGRCDRSLQTGDHRWPQAIWLQLPWLEEENPVNFSFEEPILEKAQNEAGRILLNSSPGTIIYATFDGKLQARERLQVSTRQYVGTRGNGFGHLNAYPAQLVIRSITGVSVKP